MNFYDGRSYHPSWNLWAKLGLANFFCKGPESEDFRLSGVTTTKLILVKAAMDNTQTSGLGCAEIKLYLQNKWQAGFGLQKLEKGLNLGLDVGSQITSLYFRTVSRLCKTTQKIRSGLGG